MSMENDIDSVTITIKHSNGYVYEIVIPGSKLVHIGHEVEVTEAGYNGMFRAYKATNQFTMKIVYFKENV